MWMAAFKSIIKYTIFWPKNLVLIRAIRKIREEKFNASTPLYPLMISYEQRIGSNKVSMFTGMVFIELFPQIIKQRLAESAIYLFIFTYQVMSDSIGTIGPRDLFMTWTRIS